MTPEQFVENKRKLAETIQDEKIMLRMIRTVESSGFKHVKEGDTYTIHHENRHLMFKAVKCQDKYIIRYLPAFFN